MALDTETALGTAMEEVLVIGPDVGIVASHAVHRGAVAWVQSLFTHGMGKALVPFMAIGTNILRRALDHPRPVGAVQVVTIGALVPAGMLMQHLRTPLERSGMAGLATGPLIGRQQPSPVTDMGIVTGDAGIAAIAALQMAMGLVERSQHPLVAPETAVRTLALTVAGLAVPLGERLVLDPPQQSPPIAAVGMMTTQTVERTGIAAKVGLFHPLFVFMTAQAQPGAGRLQQAIIVTAVGIVTGSATTVLKGLMRTGIGLVQAVMAAKAQFLFGFVEQPGDRRGMRRMTAAAVAFLNRLMQKRTILHALAQWLVAPLTQFTLRHDQQAFMPGDMGIVTLITTFFGDRLVNDRALEFARFVAFETGRCETRRRQKHQGKPDEYR